MFQMDCILKIEEIYALVVFQVPVCKVIRFNIEYTIHWFEEDLPEVSDQVNASYILSVVKHFELAVV